MIVEAKFALSNIYATPPRLVTSGDVAMGRYRARWIPHVRAAGVVIGEAHRGQYDRAEPRE